MRRDVSPACRLLHAARTLCIAFVPLPLRVLGLQVLREASPDATDHEEMLIHFVQLSITWHYFV